MKAIQVALVLILVVHQSYQDYTPSSYQDQQGKPQGYSNDDDALKPGIYRLRLNKDEHQNPESFYDDGKYKQQESNQEAYAIPEGYKQSGPSYRKGLKKPMFGEDQSKYGNQQEDYKRSVSVRSSKYEDDKTTEEYGPEDYYKRSVSVRSSSYDDKVPAYGRQQPQDDKKRSVSVRSTTDENDDDYGYKLEQWVEEQRKQIKNPYSLWKEDPSSIDDGSRLSDKDFEERMQAEYKRLYARSLFSGFESSQTDEQKQNKPLQQLIEKLRDHQSVPVTLREVHQIVRESQKQIWDQVVKMIPGGQLAQAKLRAQREKLFSGLAFNPFKQHSGDGNSTPSGLPGSGTIYPVPRTNRETRRPTESKRIFWGMD